MGTRAFFICPLTLLSGWPLTARCERAAREMGSETDIRAEPLLTELGFRCRQLPRSTLFYGLMPMGPDGSKARQVFLKQAATNIGHDPPTPPRAGEKTRTGGDQGLASEVSVSAGRAAWRSKYSIATKSYAACATIGAKRLPVANQSQKQ